VAFLGGVYARITTSYVDGIIWRCRRLCRAISSHRAASTGPGNLAEGQGLPERARPQRQYRQRRPSRLDPKAIARANQIEIRTDIAKLYDLVSELKEQLEKTDAAATLSISVVKKAQQIEKLAKHIKDLARG
jgi:hypothetical protein